MAADGAAHYSMDVAGLGRDDAARRLRDLAAPLYDTTYLDEDVIGRVDVHMLGPLLLCDAVNPRQRNERSPARLRADGVDQFIVTALVTGSLRLEVDDRSIEVGPGGVFLFDLARPGVAVSERTHAINIVVPRDVVEAAFPDVLQLHGLVVGDLACFYVEHLQSVIRALPHLPASTGAGVARATMEILAAAVRSTQEGGLGARAARPPHDGLMRTARLRISAELGNPGLTPDRLAGAIGVSRTALYHAFAPFGGVANFLKDVRLRTARAALLDPHDRRRVSDIARSVGFKSEAHFSRAFRDLFGASPLDMRRSLRRSETEPAGQADALEPEVVRSWVEGVARSGLD